jgi:hypothetical protein
MSLVKMVMEGVEKRAWAAPTSTAIFSSGSSAMRKT